MSEPYPPESPFKDAIILMVEENLHSAESDSREREQMLNEGSALGRNQINQVIQAIGQRGDYTQWMDIQAAYIRAEDLNAPVEPMDRHGVTYELMGVIVLDMKRFHWAVRIWVRQTVSTVDLIGHYLGYSPCCTQYFDDIATRAVDGEDVGEQYSIDGYMPCGKCFRIDSSSLTKQINSRRLYDVAFPKDYGLLDVIISMLHYHGGGRQVKETET